MTAEGLDVLLLVAKEEWRREEQAARAGSHGVGAQLQHGADGACANAGKQRLILWQTSRRTLNQRPSFFRGEVWKLSGGAADANAVDAGADQEVHQAIECRPVGRAGLIDRRQRGREDSG